MKMKALYVVIAALVITLICSTGCEPKDKMASPPQQQKTITYESVMSLQKSVKFQRPADSTTKDEFTNTKYRIVFEQTENGLDEQGNAVSNITIKSLSYVAKNQQEVQFDFDSQRQTDANKPLNQLVGKGYTIAVASGKVVRVSNAQQIRQVVQKAPDKNIAAFMFDDDAVIKRHSINGLPKALDKLSEKDKWVNTDTPKLGLIVPKTFEKKYTVKDIKSDASGRIASIEMTALPAVQRKIDTDEQLPQAAEITESFDKFFDSKDEFKGSIVINLDTGKLLKYSESLVSDNTAAHMPANPKKKHAEPDVLEIILKWSNTLVAVD